MKKNAGELLAQSELGDRISHVETLTNYTAADLILTKGNDPCCAKATEEFNKGRRPTLFVKDHSLRSFKSQDNLEQMAIPYDPPAKILRFSHHSKIVVHPSGART